MIVPGLVSATFKTKKTHEVLSLMKKAKLEAIEWSENHHLPVGDLAFSKSVGRETLSEGFRIAGYGSYYRLGENMDIRPSIETALALGTNSVRIWAGSKASSLLTEEERDGLTIELKRSVEIAKEYNVVLKLEWHKNTLTDENESALRLLKTIDSPYLKTLWQPTQALSFEERKEGIRMVLPYLSYLHVYYWDKSGRRPLSEGIEHWKSYFSLLNRDKEYFGLIEFVQNDCVEQFFADSKVLLDLLKGENYYGGYAH